MMFLGRLIDTIVWLLMLVGGAVGALVLFIVAKVGDDLAAGATGLLFLGVFLFALLKLLHWSARRQGAAAADPQAIVVLSYSTVSLVLVMSAFLSLAVACALGLLVATDQAWRLGLSIGFALALTAAVGVPIQRRVISLTLSPDGLDYSAFRTGRIPWHDITDVDVRRTFRIKAVVIALRDEEKYLQRHEKMIPRALRWQIQEQMLDVPPEWLKKAIQLRLERFGGRPAQSSVISRQGNLA